VYSLFTTSDNIMNWGSI